MLNKKLNAKFNIFEEIDKFSSNENTKQSSFKNKDFYSFNDSNDFNSIDERYNYYEFGKKINKNKSFNNTFNNKINKKGNNIKEKFHKKIIGQIDASFSQVKEKNPENFVFKLFYMDKNGTLKNKENFNSKKNKYPTKNNIFNNKFDFYEKQNNSCRDCHNISFDKINNKLLNYKSILNKINKYQDKEKKNKSKKNNNPKVEKLINKLYNEGMENIIKKELIYQENLLKKNEEYKKYSFNPNHYKKNKYKYNISKLNEDLYSKQIEWKKNKNKENFKKKQYEDEIFLSQFTFKPNLSQKNIIDDEKTIQRNLNDINNYIFKRRNQIRYKKDNEFKLREYKSDYICNNIEPQTERIFYRNNKGSNNSFISSYRYTTNYSKFDFLKAVKNLHSKICNLNI